MSEWKTIDYIRLRGGPCDGDRLDVSGPSDLAPMVELLIPSGGVATYRKTGEREQLRREGVAEAYTRHWLHEWRPDA